MRSRSRPGPVRSFPAVIPEGHRMKESPRRPERSQPQPPLGTRGVYPCTAPRRSPTSSASARRKRAPRRNGRVPPVQPRGASSSTGSTRAGREVAAGTLVGIVFNAGAFTHTLARAARRDQGRLGVPVIEYQHQQRPRTRGVPPPLVALAGGEGRAGRARRARLRARHPGAAARHPDEGIGPRRRMIDKIVPSAAAAVADPRRRHGDDRRLRHRRSRPTRSSTR